jgi:hypothetical protein
MKKLLILSFVCFALNSIYVSCKSDQDEIITTGTLKGTITDFSTNQALSNVRIIVFDANTNAPTGNSILSGSDGGFSIQLSPGTYYLKLSKQGFLDIPPTGFSPISVSIELNNQTLTDYQMQPSSVSNGGSITGKVSENGKGLAGVMIVASNTTNGYSSVTGSDGTYFIYNVPAGAYKLKGYTAGYNSTVLDVTVQSSTESSGKDISMTSGSTGSISGAVTFLATINGTVDVTLAHPITKETIPGLITKTQGGVYSLNKIPNGTFLAKASFSNDGYVVDPDWILKNGEPSVTITGNNVSLNFSVTGAVRLTSPTNDSITTKPIEITQPIPTFNWKAYSSVNDYIIEVSDLNGNVIWGGFTKAGSNITKNIIIPKTQLSIAFNSDGKATAILKKGSIYRWRIYASKDDSKEITGWKLISVSEEQRGLFIIK